LRARAYAAAELLLDVCHILRGHSGDPDAVLIYACASAATVEPLLSGAPDLIDDPAPPDQARGWISRRAIAERSGLARETVRRKTQTLIEAGLLEEDGRGRVRTTCNLADPEAQRNIDAIYAAVRRYHARVSQLTGGK
jgi:hypothetical protein